jgi:hypothetical protein
MRPPDDVSVALPLAEPPQGENPLKPIAKTSVPPETEPCTLPTPGNSATSVHPV